MSLGIGYVAAVATAPASQSALRERWSGAAEMNMISFDLDAIRNRLHAAPVLPLR